MKKRYLPLVCFIGTMLFTILASIAPLNGVTQADISNKFFTVITPAGFTFAIWSLIYFWWFISSLLIAFKDVKIDKEKKIIFSIAMVLTTLWLMAWHFSHIWLSVWIMWVILMFVAFLFVDCKDEDIDWRFWVTLEMTLWWILVATTLNIMVFFKSLQIPTSISAEIGLWVIVLILAWIVNLFLLYRFTAYVSTFVYIWALYGIWAGQESSTIKITASVIAIVLLLNFIYLRKKAYTKALKKAWEK